MRIAYLANSRFPSERAHMLQIVHTCNAFVKLGNEVSLFVTDRKTRITDAPEEYYGTSIDFEVRRVKVVDLAGYGKVAYMAQRFLYAGNFLLTKKGSEYNAIIGRDEWILWLLSLFFPLNKLAWESHEAKYNFPARRLLRKGIKCIIISEGIRDLYLSKGIPAEQMCVAHDGIDETFFGEVESKEEARQRLGIEGDKPVAMYIGGLDVWKGAETFLKAAEEAKDIQFVTIGGKPEEVRMYQKQYPAVQFLGQRPYKKLKDNQQAADVLVIPNTAKNELSAQYTSPLKLFAHLASDVPLVVSDIPSMRNVVSDEHVWFFTPDDAQDLFTKIQLALSETEQSQKKTQSAREHSREYTWKVRAEQILGFVKKEADV